jgi:hypothetical protein
VRRGEQRAKGDVLQAGGGLRQAGPRLKQQGHCGRPGNGGDTTLLRLKKKVGYPYICIGTVYVQCSDAPVIWGEVILKNYFLLYFSWNLKYVPLQL